MTDQALYPVTAKSGGLFGYIDRKGSMVVSPRYRMATPFVDGFGTVWNDNGWHLIDSVGDLIGEQLDEIITYEGVIWGRQGRLWQLVGRNGIFLGPPSWTNVRGTLSDGLCAVERWIGPAPRWGFVDRESRVVIEPAYESAMPFAEGRAAVVKSGVGHKYLFMDVTGAASTSPHYVDVSGFSEGLASVVFGSDHSVPEQCRRRKAYITRDGSVAFSHEYQKASAFHCGRAWVAQGDALGCIDKEGYEVIPARYSDALPFQRGRTFARTREGWEVIGLDGSRVGSQQFQDVDFRSWDHGPVPVSIDGRWGYVDIDGRAVTEPRYVEAVVFMNGLARVVEGDQYGYIDESGQWIWKV
jgi:WG containing repeat